MTLLARAGILWLRFKAWWRETLYRVRVRLFGRLAVEAATEGRSAVDAVASDSLAGDDHAARSRAAWADQITYLTDLLDRDVSLPQHTRLDYERLVRQLRRNVRDLDAAEARRHATPAGLGGQRLAAFGAVGQRRSFLGPVAAANPLLALATNPIAWMAAAFVLLAGWGGWNHARAERMEHQRDNARAELDATERDLLAATAERDLLRDAAAQADAQSQQAAQTIEAERARRLRAEREARRIRDAMDQARAGGSVDYGFGGVRNDQPPN